MRFRCDGERGSGVVALWQRMCLEPKEPMNHKTANEGGEHSFPVEHLHVGHTRDGGGVDTKDTGNARNAPVEGGGKNAGSVVLGGGGE